MGGGEGGGGVDFAGHFLLKRCGFKMWGWKRVGEGKGEGICELAGSVVVWSGLVLFERVSMERKKERVLMLRVECWVFSGIE